MARYVDGFVLPVPKNKVAGRIWREYGALELRECVGDDLKVKGPKRMMYGGFEVLVDA
jgi:uncharacterized protein YbaA (DUF1428 family)